MLVFYCVLRELAPDTSEVCLVDVSYEATEIGIVRDGILKYVTHAPLGIYSLSRDIASLCELPKEEALSYIRGNSALEDCLSTPKKAELKEIIRAFEDKMTELFNRTGDTLSIPKPLFVHTDRNAEKFFSKIIKNAAKRATKGEHGIHLVTSKLLGESTLEDTALLLSAHFFHKNHGCEDFKQM